MCAEDVGRCVVNADADDDAGGEAREISVAFRRLVRGLGSVLGPCEYLSRNRFDHRFVFARDGDAMEDAVLRKVRGEKGKIERRTFLFENVTGATKIF